nr:probable receptor-like protein kinase At5g59700 [Tanacetum cinerariifolium]
MSSSGLNLNNLLIPLEEIELATENFDSKNWIRYCDFGVLYSGQLCDHWKNRIAALKCLQEKEFLNELKFISSFNHENIISFIGYCNEDEYMIIFYEYPVNGIHS